MARSRPPLTKLFISAGLSLNIWVCGWVEGIPFPRPYLFSVFAEHWRNVVYMVFQSFLPRPQALWSIIWGKNKALTLIGAQRVCGKTGYLMASALDMVAMFKTQSYH